jgi:hypothetical protein
MAALKGDKTLAELAAKYDVHQPDPALDDVVAGRCDWLFMSPAEKRGTERAPTAEEIQAKIGQPVPDVDFLEVALDRVAMRAQSDGHRDPPAGGEAAGGVAGDLRSNVYYLLPPTPERDLAIERERARGARFRGSATCEALLDIAKNGASSKRKHDDQLRYTSPRKRGSVRGGSARTRRLLDLAVGQ